MPMKVPLPKMMKNMMIVLAKVQTMKTKMILMMTTDVVDAIDANEDTETLMVIQIIRMSQKTIVIMDATEIPTAMDFTNSDMRIA